jgi:hypothetical protein
MARAAAALLLPPTATAGWMRVMAIMLSWRPALATPAGGGGIRGGLPTGCQEGYDLPTTIAGSHCGNVKASMLLCTVLPPARPWPACSRRAMWTRWRGCALGWQLQRMVSALQCAALCCAGVCWSFVLGLPPAPSSCPAAICGACGPAGHWHCLPLPAGHCLPPTVPLLPPCLLRRPAPPVGEQRALLLSRVVVTNMPSGEAATFTYSEWFCSCDPSDFELNAAEEQASACSCRLQILCSAAAGC